MISMYRKKEILNYHIVYHYGAKKIISQMKKEGKIPASRGTIRKLINTYEDILRREGKEAANEYVNSKEVFHTPERKPSKLDEQAREYIEYCLEENEKKKAENNEKQCIDMTRAWQILCEEKGYGFCYSTVTGYARKCRNGQKSDSSHECFIRQYHPAGEECQFDWGEVKVKICGRRQKLRMAVFTLPHSNYRRAYLFQREHTLAFMEAHRNFFHDTGRIPQRMVYDNMRVAVKRFVGTLREPTDALLRLSNFYQFQYRFCNAYSGNEKGNVEESVKYVRKYVFSVRDEFDSLDDAQAYLDSGCAKLNQTHGSLATADIERLTEEDFSAMRQCNGDIACFRMEDRQVNNYGFVTVERSFYSVPDTLALKTVSVRIFTNKIEVVHESKTVAVHDKVDYGKYDITLDHYLHTFRCKPGALRNAVALQQAPQGIRRIFSASFADSPKDFVELLVFARDENIPYDDIVAAHDRLKGSHVHNVTLQLMTAALKPEQQQNTLMLVSSQEGKDIENNAQKALSELTLLMDNLSLPSYATR